MEQFDSDTDIGAIDVTPPDQTHAGNANPIKEMTDGQSNSVNSTDTNAWQPTSTATPVAEKPSVEDTDEASAQDGKAEKPANDDADAQARTATVCIAFRDFGLEPIEGLKYKLKVDGQFKKGMTDAEGNTATLTDLTPGSDIEVFVFREHAKDFKSIGMLRAYPGCTGYSIVSPKLKYDVTTELHFGRCPKFCVLRSV